MTWRWGSTCFLMVSIAALACQHSCDCSVQPATYIVGDDLGWTYLVSMETWPEGKKFYVGDTLVFMYDPDNNDNVAIVNKTGFETCTLTEDAIVYRSGNDKIQLQSGETYFINTANFLCPLGMKMEINATARPPSL